MPYLIQGSSPLVHGGLYGWWYEPYEYSNWWDLMEFFWHDPEQYKLEDRYFYLYQYPEKFDEALFDHFLDSSRPTYKIDLIDQSKKPDFLAEKMTQKSDDGYQVEYYRISAKDVQYFYLICAAYGGNLAEIELALYQEHYIISERQAAINDPREHDIYLQPNSPGSSSYNLDTYYIFTENNKCLYYYTYEGVPTVISLENPDKFCDLLKNKKGNSDPGKIRLPNKEINELIIQCGGVPFLEQYWDHAFPIQAILQHELSKPNHCLPEKRNYGSINNFGGGSFNFLTHIQFIDLVSYSTMQWLGEKPSLLALSCVPIACQISMRRALAIATVLLFLGIVGGVVAFTYRKELAKGLQTKRQMNSIFKEQKKKLDQTGTLDLHYLNYYRP